MGPSSPIPSCNGIVLSPTFGWMRYGRILQALTRVGRREILVCTYTVSIGLNDGDQELIFHYIDH